MCVCTHTPTTRIMYVLDCSIHCLCVNCVKAVAVRHRAKLLDCNVVVSVSRSTLHGAIITLPRRGTEVLA